MFHFPTGGPSVLFLRGHQIPSPRTKANARLRVLAYSCSTAPASGHGLFRLPQLFGGCLAEEELSQGSLDATGLGNGTRTPLWKISRRRFCRAAP